jgi:gliding motility-associated-like protein
VIGLIAFHNPAFSQCTGIDADAGPDLFTCDPAQLLQLQGSVQGNYSKIYWTPANGLSDANILDPIVTNKNPGKYTYKLNAEGLSTVNLIVNGDFESGNTGFNTGYTYTTVNTTEGEYFIASNPSLWNGGFSSCGDHTTGSGNMLLLNGHPNAGTNCWCQTVTTVVGRMYQFEFWSMSVYPTNVAQLNVKLNGNQIGATQAGPLCDWQRFVVSFTATSTSTTLCISETSGIRAGNDFALDDIALFEKCVDMDDVMVEIVNLVAKIDIPFKPKCSSDVFDLNAIGSSTGPNIRYEWSTDFGTIVSQNGINAKGRGSGTYTVKVIYTNGNSTCETEASIEYIAPDVLVGNIYSSGKVNCSGDSVRLKIDIASGGGLYTYKWSPDTSILKGQFTDSVLVNKARKYTVTITDQTSGCTLILDYDVKSDTVKPSVAINGDTLLDCRKTKVLLNANLTDSVKYFFKWIAPDQSVLLNQSKFSHSISGAYKLIIEDKTNHCSDSANWNVVIDTLHPELDLGNDLNIDCKNNGVRITNQFNNALGNISYYWIIDTTRLSKENVLIDKSITKASKIVLKLVNELNGCETSDSLVVTDTRLIPILDAGPDELITCKRKQIQLLASVNQNDSLSISWSTVTGNIVSATDTLQATVDKKGWYYIHILNQNNGCENLDSLFVDENILAPDAIPGPDLIFSCADSLKTIDGSASSSGNNIIYQWTSQNGNIKSGSNTNKIDVSSPGTYQLIVQDLINGCSDTAFITVTPDDNKPIVSIASPDTLSCLNTEIILTASANSQSGGILNYNWSNSSGAPIQSPNALQTKITVPGIYSFTATDQTNGCSSIIQTIVNIDTLKPIIDAGIDKVWNCASTQFVLNGNDSNNSRTHSFNWTTPNGNIIGNPDQKNVTITSPGTYTFLVIDETNGCASIDSLEVIPDLLKPVVNIVSPDTLNCIKTDIQINAQASSSGNRYQLLWSSVGGNIIGNTNASIIQADKPGWYLLTILDTVNKCITIDSVLVIEDKQTPIVDAGSSTELTCQILDLILIGNISNSKSNFLNWKTNQGNIVGKSDSLQIKINQTGWYYLEVTNTSNGCNGIDSVFVTKRNNLIVDAGSAIELTCLVKDQVLSGSIQNGAGNEQIIWSSNQGHFIGNTNTFQVKVDRPGWYYFQVTNNTTGCNGVDSVLITENTNVPASLNLTIDQPKCPGDSWQTEITNISGGEHPIQIYLDNQFITGLILQGNAAGNHVIKVIDKNGCELTRNFNIISPQGVSIQLIPLVKLSAGQDYNIIPQYSIPDDSIATVQWSPSDYLSCTDCPYPVIQNIDKEIEYFVTYTNRNGCSATARIRIEIAKRGIWVPNTFSPNGDNVNDWFFPVAVEDSYNTIRSMSIYDRWGNRVFEKENFQANMPTEGWNGQFNDEKMNPGVFVYVIEVEWKNGERQILKGDLTLIK